MGGERANASRGQASSSGVIWQAQQVMVQCGANKRSRELGAGALSFTFQPMDDACAQAVLAWRYEPPYSFYNADLDEIDRYWEALLNPANAYYSMIDEAGELVAYCCYGQDARVSGGDYRDDALDLGLGVRPDLTGQGRGQAFVEAVLEFAMWTYAPAEIRVTVAAFNRRALRVWEKAGFEPVHTFSREEDGVPFVVLTRKL